MRNLKALEEKRAALLAEMTALVDKADGEVRAMTEEENKEFEQKEKEIKDIDATIAAEKRSRTYEGKEEPTIVANSQDDDTEKRAQAETALFEDYIRGNEPEQRADINLDYTDNGAVIPSTIANKIIDKIKDICPIFALSDTYSLPGDLQIPYYDDAGSDVEMGYHEDFTELEAKSGKFASITLKGFLAGALTKIGRRLINNSKFDITNFIINKMAQIISLFIERELLVGTDGKVAGLKGVTQVVTAGSAVALTADDLIDIQEEVIDAYQKNAVWIMNRSTRKALRKLKDADGNYILNRDMTTKWGYVLLGRPVHTSDNMPKMDDAGGSPVIYYGDMKGLATKISEDINIEVLREKFATQHAIGIVGWVEFDAKVQNTQMIAALKMASV